MVGKIIALMTSVLAVGAVSLWGESYLNNQQTSVWSSEAVSTAPINVLSASTTVDYSNAPASVDVAQQTQPTQDGGGATSSVSTQTQTQSVSTETPLSGQIISSTITTGAYNGSYGVMVVQATITNNTSSPVTYDNTNQKTILVWLSVNGTVYPYSWQAAQGYGLGDTPSQVINPGQSITVTLHFLTGLPPAQLQKGPDIVHIGVSGSDFALEFNMTNGQ